MSTRAVADRLEEAREALDTVRVDAVARGFSEEARALLGAMGLEANADEDSAERRGEFIKGNAEHYWRGLRSSNVVGMSSATVGWMCTECVSSDERLARVHGGENAVDGLVAAGAEEGCAENLLRFCVDENLDEAEGLALLDGAADAGHGAHADERRLLCRAHFGFGHPDVGERRVDVEGVCENAVADATRSPMEEIVGDDFVVVVRSVGEGAAAVAVADSENAGSGGAELIVDGDVAALVGCDAGRGQVQVVGVGHAAHGQQHVRAGDVGRAFVAFEADSDLIAAALEMNAVGADANLDAFGFEDVANHLGGVFVFVGSEAGGFVDDGDLRAEAAKHLRELEANGAAADDDEVLGELVEIEDGGAGEERNRIDAGHFRE